MTAGCTTTQLGLVLCLSLLTLASCGQQDSRSTSTTQASTTTSPQEAQFQEESCAETFEAQYEGVDDNGQPLLKASSTLLASAFFDGGYTEPESSYFRQCQVLAEGKTVLFNLRGEATSCASRALSQSQIKELKRLRDEVETEAEVVSDYGICDAPSYGISLRASTPGTDTYTLEKNQDCADRLSRNSPKAQELRQKLMVICESVAEYKQWRDIPSQYPAER
jgi:hypothetical protein